MGSRTCRPMLRPDQAARPMDILHLTQSRFVAFARQELHLDVHLSDSQGVVGSFLVSRIDTRELGGCTHKGDDRDHGEDQQCFHRVTPCGPPYGYSVTVE